MDNQECGAWRPEYRYRRVFFKECAIAGVSFHVDSDDELWNELGVGASLALVRERDNKYDCNAVAVALADDYDGKPDDFDFDFILGYVPRGENRELAAMMDAGYADKFSAEVTSYRPFGRINDRIRMTIYIESREPEIVRPDLLRAQFLSAADFMDMTGELERRGTAYFRFGGSPHHELKFPAVGEKIVMAHQREDSVILYLMRVLAAGDDCAAYVDDPDSIDCDDDCAPYILTNIMGPVKTDSNEHGFLAGTDLKGLNASEYLSKRLSDDFSEIFRSMI